MPLIILHGFYEYMLWILPCIYDEFGGLGELVLFD